MNVGILPTFGKHLHDWSSLSSTKFFFFIEMHMPWQKGDQSHVCILSISIVSPLSRIFLLYFGIILILYFFLQFFIVMGAR